MSAINEYEYQQIHDKRLAESICVAATVKVVAFDPAKMTVDVQPLSKHLQNGKYESQPPILGVPVACTRCGGFITRPWIKVGDTGVVVYLDHDMDSTVTGGKEAKPLTERNHGHDRRYFHRRNRGGQLLVLRPTGRQPCSRHRKRQRLCGGICGRRCNKGKPDRDGEREQLRQHKRGGQHDRCPAMSLPRVA